MEAVYIDMDISTYIYKCNDFTAEIDQDLIHLKRREAKSR